MNFVPQLFVSFCKTYRMFFMPPLFVSFFLTVVTTPHILKAFTPSKMSSMFSTGGIAMPSMHVSLLVHVKRTQDLAFVHCTSTLAYNQNPPKYLKQKRTNIVKEHARGRMKLPLSNIREGLSMAFRTF